MIGAMLTEAIRAMIANRMRSFLTMLGMVIGVAAVIIMSAIGSGTQESVKNAIASMGSNILIVFSGTTTSGGARMAMGAAPTLTLSDAQAVKELSMITTVAPSARGVVQLVNGPNNWNTQVEGSTPDYFTLGNWQFSSGGPFLDSDVRSATRVAILGQKVASELFGQSDPVGKTIRMKQTPYLVIGVLAPKGQSLDGRDQDDIVIVPVTTAQRKLLGTQIQGSVRMMMAQAKDEQSMAQAQEQITQLLRQRHRIKEGMDDDFSVKNLSALVNTVAQTTESMSLMLAAIAAISLIVGGIGIMNIMLVSVTERTREIGIRIAIGATQKSILLQFLLEALVISILGSAIGVIVGVSGALLVEAFFHTTVIFTGSSIVSAFGVAAGVGIFFGYYPAKKAAAMEPIEALRYQ